jgi:hypothetical protein
VQRRHGYLRGQRGRRRIRLLLRPIRFGCFHRVSSFSSSSLLLSSSPLLLSSPRLLYSSSSRLLLSSSPPFSLLFSSSPLLPIPSQGARFQPRSYPTSHSDAPTLRHLPVPYSSSAPLPGIAQSNSTETLTNTSATPSTSSTCSSATTPRSTPRTRACASENGVRRAMKIGEVFEGGTIGRKGCESDGY